MCLCSSEESLKWPETQHQSGQNRESQLAEEELEKAQST